MTWLRDRWLPLAVLVAAVSALISSLVWAAGSGFNAWSPGSMMGPTGVMGSVLRGDGPVDDFEKAARAAGRFADRWGLQVGEIMQFDNGYYAELIDPSGNPATEVLVDQRSGSVRVEWGPAMMWNTAYGMHPRADDAETVSADQARVIADAWLRDNRNGEHAGEADAFPGYYTLHTLRGDDDVVGMISVNATTGTVWHHSWHGELIAMTEHDEAR